MSKKVDAIYDKSGALEGKEFVITDTVKSARLFMQDGVMHIEVIHKNKSFSGDAKVLGAVVRLSSEEHIEEFPDLAFGQMEDPPPDTKHCYICTNETKFGEWMNVQGRYICKDCQNTITHLFVFNKTMNDNPSLNPGERYNVAHKKADEVVGRKK